MSGSGSWARGRWIATTRRADGGIGEVVGAHEATVRVLHPLRQIGVAMAGPDVVEPYRD
ncbi:MAG TPA: hypothetical protein VIA06_08965 [Candidatus Dormibacteraeota bacterium]|nr:hypothetical protein [Candidatus Dormibacteraeota bacterium]